MPRPSDAVIPLHAPVTARSVVLGGSDANEVSEQVAAQLADALGGPAGVVLTSSCSAGLDAMASLVDLRPGDEVVVPAFSFPTSAAPFAARGARLRFADVDLATGNVSASSMEARLSERTRAVVVAHYGGVAADLGGIGASLERLGAVLLEDAAHGLFGSSGGRALGTLGRFGALSFHRTKNISATEGGALVVNDPSDLPAALVAVDKGTNRARFEAGEVASYEWSGLGSAWRMGEGPVRYLAAELASASQVQARRHEVWSTYQAELSGWAIDNDVALPVVRADRAHPAHLFFVVLPDGARDSFVAHCASAGVQVARHFGSLPHSAFGRTIADPDDSCPNALALERRLVRLPLHHRLSAGDVDRVIDVVTSWSEGLSLRR